MVFCCVRWKPTVSLHALDLDVYMLRICVQELLGIRGKTEDMEAL